MKLLTALILLGIIGIMPAYGFNNQAGDFEAGSSQYLNITDASQTGLDLTNLTFAAWVKFESQPPTNHYRLVAKRATNQIQYSFYYSVSECVGSCLVITSGDVDCATEVLRTSAVTTLTNGRWYHVAAVLTNASTNNFIYLDGVRLAEVSQVAGSIQNCTGAFEVGSTNGGIQNMDGLIDELSVWNRVLSPDEIRGLMKKQLTGKETGLVGYWPMEGDFRDRSNNANHLTNNNSVTMIFDRAYWDSYFMGF